MVDKATSDEKLLKIIESTSGKRPAQKVGIKPKLKGRKLFPLKLKLKLNLSILVRGVFVICGLLTLFFIYMLVDGTRIIDKNLGLPAKEGESYFAKLITGEQAEFLSKDEYLNEIKLRNSFLPAELRPSVVGEGISPSAEELLQDLSLVGIVWSKNPEVMIESATEQKTYLLKRGEIFGQQQYKVKDITRSSVILEIEKNAETMEYELR